MTDTNEQQAGAAEDSSARATVATHERTVTIALFRYRDPESNAMRVGFRGEQVTITAADLARGDKMGALAELDDDELPAGPRTPVTAPRTPDQPEPSELTDPAGNVAPTREDITDPTRNLGPIDPAAQPAHTDELGGQHGAPHGGEHGQRPRQVASKATWVDYAVEHRGADRGEAEALSKDELIDRYGRD